MPILPLDHPEPFAATLGVMLYPAMDKADPAKARAFAAQWLGEPLRRLREAGHLLTYDALERIAIDAGQPLIDLDEAMRDQLADSAPGAPMRMPSHMAVVCIRFSVSLGNVCAACSKP